MTGGGHPPTATRYAATRWGAPLCLSICSPQIKGVRGSWISMKLHRILGITQKSAWHLIASESAGSAGAIRGTCRGGPFVGGKEKNKTPPQGGRRGVCKGLLMRRVITTALTTTSGPLRERVRRAPQHEATGYRGPDGGDGCNQLMMSRVEKHLERSGNADTNKQSLDVQRWKSRNSDELMDGGALTLSE